MPHSKGPKGGSKYGSKQPPKREQKRESREAEKQVAKDRADKYAETRKRFAEKRAVEDSIDPELMAATYGPNWRAIIEKELFPATPDVPTVRETRPAEEPELDNDEDLDLDLDDRELARRDLGLHALDDDQAA